jgi:DDE family transposase
MKTTDAAIQLIKDAKKACIDAKYLLFDSWFSFPSFISDVRKEGYQTISVLKDMSRVFYRYKGCLRRLSKVYAIINTKRFDKNDPHIASVIAEYKNKEGKWEPLKICFVREKCNKRNWIAVATTDISLSPEEVVRIYSKRWNIEVFFKVCKSNLRLAKEFQSRSFDSIVARVAIVFTRYLMLSYENRVSIDDRSIDDLFYACCDELQDIKFLEALFLILDVLNSLLKDKLLLSEQTVKEALDYFFNSIPSFISSKLAFANCKS